MKFLMSHSYPIRTSHIGLAAFALLLILSIVFYLERIAHIDMAFQSFLILKSGKLAIQSERFGAAVTQVWPWAAQALHLPLRGVLLAYSIGHALWPALVFAWCLYLRQEKWAQVLLLVVTGMVTHTFYWLSEMPQGLVFLVGLLAWMSAKGSLAALQSRQCLWVAAVVTAFYFHPLILFAAVFASFFFIFRENLSWAGYWKQARSSVFGGLLLVLALTVIAKYIVFKVDRYDAGALTRLTAFRQYWPHWLSLPSNRDLFHYCLQDYLFVPLAILSCTAFYLWRRKWLQAVLTPGYTVAFILLVNVPYHESTHQFYMENLWLPLGLFAAIPLVFDVLPGLFSKKTATLIVGFIVLAGIVRIGLAHKPWTARLNWERHFLQETAALPHKKLLLSEQQAPMDLLKLAWSTPYEFLTLSSLQSPDSARSIIIVPDPQRYNGLLTQPRLFLGPFTNYSYDEIPTRYFHLTDTSAYVLMPGK